MMFGAHTTATSQSLLCKLSHASLRAVREDEQAVSTDKLGPVRLRQKEILLAYMGAVIPVEVN